MSKFQIFQDKAPQLDPQLKIQKAFGWDGIVDLKTHILVSNRYSLARITAVGAPKRAMGVAA